MSIAERIYETVKDLPQAQAAEVLDFAESVRAKHPTAPPPILTVDARRLCAELQAFVASQPEQTESAVAFVRRLRDETLY